MNAQVSSVCLACLVVVLVVGATTAAPASNKGPQIILKSPELRRTTALPTIQTTTKADFEVVFEPREVAVDMRSLSVWARKGIFKKSLTEWLKPYIRGNAIVAEGIALPIGQFVLEIQIADKVGQHTSQKFRVAVK